MEVFCFAIFIALTFTPWSSGEEKLLYQTPDENLWGGWETFPRSSTSVIIFVVLSCTYRLLAPHVMWKYLKKIIIIIRRTIKNENCKK